MARESFSASSAAKFKVRDIVLAVTAGSVLLIIIFLSTNLGENHANDNFRVKKIKPRSEKQEDDGDGPSTRPAIVAGASKRRDTNDKKARKQQQQRQDKDVAGSSLSSSSSSQAGDEASAQATATAITPPPVDSDPSSAFSSEPEDPVYHNQYPLPRRKKIFNKPPKIVINDKTTSPAAENMFNRFYDSFDETKLFKDRNVVPAMISPTFHDGDVLHDLLMSVDVPIRHLIFICNAEDDRVEKLLKELEPLEAVGGMTVFRFDGENRGFAKSVNLGMRRARQIFLGYSEHQFLGKWPRDRLPIWYSLVNCDSVFTAGAWQKFASVTNKELIRNVAHEDKRTPGLFYGHVVDQYAFGVSDAAIRKAGYFDEVFFPAYMEDIDFKWRIHLAGFRTVQISSARIDHHQSINLKRQGGSSNFRMQMHRGGLGFEYGWMKWGYYEQHHTRGEFPPSGRKFPFGIEGFPLHLWKIDPVHRHCIESSHGVYFKHSSTCWYNGTGLLKELLPSEREWKLPKFLTENVESMRDYLKMGAKNDRTD